ncbi:MULTISPECIES: precorrin-6A reductase [Flavobacterium]|uniref:Precorrin-6A reductase n=1 Tax=Flavobacterium covae TaxID=2906076 RepID=A0ABW8PGN7_9FLAO|nr:MULTISPECIES: precorrin-6A reductase [Flavobacterium]OXA83123.1 precorrin-6A reductase [Flavobacterium columnare] [Flavobacterium columnare NBRC 100251 = ATCC 23463]AMA48910.1 precorrin-6x reductase [Flavobacterium covae]MCJ1807170.1 precorrin-6A reductase [Flavobacterium covae]MCJ1810094.1 precorrin-6A reductase [Flavobacterium covae]OWP80918.1 precorrin-6A reductase [Flavobacterium covae]
MILVFGGTTEGKKVAKFLEKEALSYFYSTKTEIKWDEEYSFGNYRFGALTPNELIQFCTKNKIQIIIHASHPFAELLHECIAQASQILSIPVIRFERKYPKKIISKEIIYVKNYKEAIDYLMGGTFSNLLALTGVQTIEKLKPYWEKHSTYFRILPRKSSIIIAEKAGFPTKKIIMEYPSNDLNYEINIIKKYNCDAIITKESGESGFLSTKIEAAKRNNIPIIIIQRKPLPNSFILVSNEIDLFNAISLIK